MTTVEKYKKLVERLYEATVRRGIDWTYDEQLGTYAPVSNHIICLSETQNYSDDHLEVISIRSKDWQVLDEFNDEKLTGPGPSGYEEFGSYYLMMKVLHSSAYRQAIGADDAIDDILDALG